MQKCIAVSRKMAAWDALFTVNTVIVLHCINSRSQIDEKSPYVKYL